MKLLASLLHIPQDILGYVGGLLVAAGAMMATTIQGIIPSPPDAAEWPIYGVLITSNVVLFLSIAGILRWVDKRLLAAQAASTAAIVENSQALKKVSETLEKQNTWFTDFGKSALQFQFEHARMSVHSHHEGGKHE
jgi:hypothetical protein